MVVDKEMFWGVDFIAHLETFLAGNDAAITNANELTKWQHITASAHRRH